MTRLAVAVLLVALSACSKSEPPAPAAPPASSEAPAKAPAVASTPAPGPSASVATTPEVPVEEDFEDEANEKVTAQTLDAQLDALEKEIKAN